MKKIFIILALVILGGFGTSKVFACGGWFEAACGSTSDIQQNEQGVVAQTIDKLQTAVPAPQLQDSLERANISKRLQLFSNPNKVSYIYLISYGKVMAFYTVKGKITSGSKRLTNNQELVDCTGGNGYTDQCVMNAPELDGTYGGSDNYIYFWTTDGIYVQWNGEYMMADQPLQLSTPPELVQTVK